MGIGVRIDVGVHLVHPECISIGNNCWIDRYSIVLAGAPHEGERKLFRRPNPAFEHAEGDVVIGDNCHLAPHTVIIGHGGVQIGANSTVAAGAKIVSLSHHHRNLADPSDGFRYRFGSMAPAAEQALIAGPVVMEENTALAMNSVMLPGSTIERDSWVGATSLVTETIPSDHLAWGIPAQPVKRRAGGSAGQ